MDRKTPAAGHKLRQQRAECGAKLRRVYAPHRAKKKCGSNTRYGMLKCRLGLPSRKPSLSDFLNRPRISIVQRTNILRFWNFTAHLGVFPMCVASTSCRGKVRNHLGANFVELRFSPYLFYGFFVVSSLQYSNSMPVPGISEGCCKSSGARVMKK